MASTQGPQDPSASESGNPASTPSSSGAADESAASASRAATPAGASEHPLRDIADAFSAVKSSLDAGGGRQLDLRLFVTACESINILFSLLGVAFSFAGKDYVEKVKDLRGACSEFPTTEAMLEKDLADKTEKVRGSHSRNLLRVIRGLDLNKRLFQYLLEDSSQSLRAVAGRAYEEVFSKHHSWAIRSLVSAGLLALPSAHQFLAHLHEDENSCREPAEKFVQSVTPVIKHVEAMFNNKGLGIDW